MQRRLSSVDFYTIGYERLGIEELFLLLLGAGVKRLIDVRVNPWSNVPDYCAAALEERLRAIGEERGHFIEYISMRELGNPFRDQGWKEQYRQRITKNKALKELHDLIISRPSALMCYEKDPSDCHRSLLAQVMRERYGLEHADLRA